MTQSLLYTFFVSNALSLFYALYALLYIGFQFLKNPFQNPVAVKLKLEPPAPLTDPKYGVHKYLKVNNIMMHYVDSGDHSKPLMIFIHGFPEFWYSWRHQIVEFNKDYWCVAVDMRGYADSEKPEGLSSYKVDVLVDDVRDLVRQLGRDKCILVSHDWGGLIACKFRDRFPEVLSAVVILASASMEAWQNRVWSDPDQKYKSWYVFFYRVPAIPEMLLRMNDLAILDKAMLVTGKDAVTKQDIECYKYWFRKQYTLTPPINYYRSNFAYTLPEKKVCEQKVPFLAAHAANDAYLSPLLLEDLKKEYKHIETAIVDGCSHFLQQEEPVKVNKLIRDFLKKHNM